MLARLFRPEVCLAVADSVFSTGVVRLPKVMTDQVAVLLSFLSLTVLLLSTAPGSSAPEAVLNTTKHCNRWRAAHVRATRHCAGREPMGATPRFRRKRRPVARGAEPTRLAAPLEQWLDAPFDVRHGLRRPALTPLGRPHGSGRFQTSAAFCIL